MVRSNEIQLLSNHLIIINTLLSSSTTWQLNSVSATEVLAHRTLWNVPLMKEVLYWNLWLLYDIQWGWTFVGKCSDFEIKGHNMSEISGYITLLGNVSELNEYMCGPMNGKGLVCSKCIKGFGPSIISLGYICHKCVWYGIPFYLFVEFVLVTVFMSLLFCFRSI